MRRWIAAVLGLALVTIAGTADAQAPTTSGGLVAQPQLNWSSNLLTNGDFEGGTSNGWSTGSGWSVDTTTSHGGTKSLKRTGTAGDATQTFNFQPGIYRLTAWVKTNNIGATPSGIRLMLDLRPQPNFPSAPENGLHGTNDWQQIEVRVTVQNAGAGTIVLQNYGGVSQGDAWFDDISLQKLLPQPVNAFMLYPNFRGMLFDDQSLTATFDVTVTIPDAEAVTDGNGPRFKVRASLYPEGGSLSNPLSTQEFLVTTRTMTVGNPSPVQLNGAGMSLGTPYRARIALLRTSDNSEFYAYPEYRLLKVAGTAKSSMNVSFDDKNRILLHGVPRFVLGVYDANLGVTTDVAAYEQMLWAANGDRRMGPLTQGTPDPANPSTLPLAINMYLQLFYGAADATAMNALMTNLASHGVMYLQTGNCVIGADNIQNGTSNNPSGRPFQIDDMPTAETYVRNLSAHDGSAGYYTMDECNSFPDNIPGSTFSQYLRLREWAPDSITFGATDKPLELSIWRDEVDIMSTDPYPLVDGRNDHNRVADWTLLARDAVKNARPYMTVLQFNHYRSQPYLNFPTPADMRTDAYLAIVSGAKGLFWWELGGQEGGLAQVDLCNTDQQHPTYSPTWDCPRRTELMNQLKSLVWELGGQHIANVGDSGLEPILLEPDSPASLTSVKNSNNTVDLVGPGTIRTLVKLHQNQLGATEGWVIAVNYTNQNLGAVTFTWNTTPGTVTVYGEGDRSVATSGSTFTDNFGPFQAHVYRISNAGGGGGNNPVVTITAPAPGITVSGTVNVTLTASGGTGTGYTFTLTDGVTQFNGNPPFSWNTTTLPNGSYTLTATVRDSAGNPGSSSIMVTVSNLGASFSNPVDGAPVSGTVNVVMVASGAAPGSITYKLTIDGTVKTNPTLSTSTASYSWDTSALGQGSSHTLVLDITDSAGHTATKTITVTVNNLPMTASFTNPTNNQTVTGAVTVGMSVAGAAAGPNTFKLSVDGALVNTQSPNASTASYSWDTTCLANGTHTLALTVDDSSNRHASASIQVTTSNTPVASITAPVNGASVSGAVTVNMAASDACAPNSYKLYIDGTLTTTVSGGATASYSWNTSGLASGSSHTLYVQVTDSQNRTGTSSTISVTVAGTPLNLYITQPTSGSTVSGTNWVVLWHDGQQGTPTCTLKLDGVQVAQQTCSDNPTSIPWNTMPFTNGTRRLSATITDSTTRVGSAAVDVVVNNTPLTVAITAPANGDTVSGTNWVVVWPGGQQGTPTCTVLVDGVQVAQQACGSSPTSIPWNTTTATDGSHTLVVRITDSTARVGTAGVTISVQNTPLTVAITAPTSGQTVSGTNWVTVWPGGAQGTPTCAVRVDGTLVAEQACSASPTSIPWDTMPFTNGSHTIVVTITDSTTRSGAAAVNVTVNNTPLTVAITSPTDGSTVSGTNWVIVWPGGQVGTPTCTITVAGVQVAQQACADSPTSIPWNTTQIANGARTLTVTITDSTTRTGTASKSITISN